MARVEPLQFLHALHEPLPDLLPRAALDPDQQDECLAAQQISHAIPRAQLPQLLIGLPGRVRLTGSEQALGPAEPGLGGIAVVPVEGQEVLEGLGRPTPRSRAPLLERLDLQLARGLVGLLRVRRHRPGR